jgi:hypothetical protein
MGPAATSPTGGPKPTAEATSEPAPTAEASAPKAATEPAKPVLKTYDLTEYKLPFSTELSEKATPKSLSDGMAKAGFTGATIYDDGANIGMRVHTVPDKLRTIAALKADLKAAYRATFLREKGEWLVYDKTNGGETKEFGLTLRIDVGGTVYTCESAVIHPDAVEKLDASIAACTSLKPLK